MSAYLPTLHPCVYNGQLLWQKRPVRDMYLDTADMDYQRYVGRYIGRTSDADDDGVCYVCV